MDNKLRKGYIWTEKEDNLLRELAPGRCKVSARSHPGFDCSALCARFGGGGHKMASGCTVDASPEETREMLVQAALEVL